MTDAERAEIEAFSKRMHNYFHYGADPIRKIRCSTLWGNCQQMLYGNESPELKRALAANLADLERYDAHCRGVAGRPLESKDFGSE